jgi:hypothetical protein
MKTCPRDRITNASKSGLIAIAGISFCDTTRTESRNGLAQGRWVGSGKRGGLEIQALTSGLAGVDYAEGVKGVLAGSKQLERTVKGPWTCGADCLD